MNLSKAQLRKLMPRRNKYNVSTKERRTADGIVFASRKEMERYKSLKALQSAGHCWFIRQPIFDTGGGTTYRADFLVVWTTRMPSGTQVSVVVEDTKGHKTSAYIRAKKQVEALYPIKIKET